MAGKALSMPSFFDFFGLPRELRDLVLSHDDLFDHIRRRDYETNATLTLTMPTTKLLLVSHQFNEEYTDVYDQNLTLKVRDSGFTDHLKMHIPEQARTARFLYLELRLVCMPKFKAKDCDIPADVQVHNESLSHILPQMPRLKAVKVSLFTQPHIDKVHAQQAISIRAAKIAGVDDRVVALRVYTHRSGAISRFSTPELLIGDWQKDSNGKGKMVFFAGKVTAKTSVAHETLKVKKVAKAAKVAQTVRAVKAAKAAKEEVANAANAARAAARQAKAAKKTR